MSPAQTLSSFLSPPPSPSLASSVVASKYSLLLSGLAPFADFWIPLAAARQAVEELDISDIPGVSELLDWKTRTAWTCVEWNEGTSDTKTGERSGDLVSKSVVAMYGCPARAHGSWRAVGGFR